MKLNTFIIALFCLFLVRTLKAQDPVFSQVFFNKVSYNPAYIGNNLGASAMLAHRSQWTAVPSRFNTSYAQFSTSLSQLNAGIGATILHNVEGNGKLRTFSFDILGSKVIKLVDQSNDKLFSYFGLGASVNQKSVNWENFVFADQFDPITGDNGDASTAQVPSNPSNIYPDFNTGFALKGLHKKLFYNFGFSVDHILSPNESIFGTTQGRLPRKYATDVFLGMPIQSVFKNFRKDFFLVPGFVLQNQLNFQTAFIGSSIKNRNLDIGAWYKSRLLNFKSSKNDAIVLNVAYMAQLNKDYRYILSYSYDVTINRLVTNTAGSHEVTLILTHYPKEKYQSAKYNNCATFDRQADNSMPFIW